MATLAERELWLKERIEKTEKERDAVKQELKSAEGAENEWLQLRIVKLEGQLRAYATAISELPAASVGPHASFLTEIEEPLAIRPQTDTGSWARLREKIRGAVEKHRASLADPSANTWLPFPSVNCRVPSWFTRRDGLFYFVGRPQFEDLLDQIVNKCRGANHLLQWLGTIGYGKSHLLAAVACCLLAEGWNVVYIPDCSDLLDTYVAYHVLRDALLLAFAGMGTHIAAIEKCVTIDALVQWCIDSLPVAKDSKLIFLLDQAHAVVDDKRAGWLHGLLFDYSAVKAVTLLDPGMLRMLSKHRSATTVVFFGGLSEVEYAAWLEMHEERLPAVADSPDVDDEERSADDEWNRQRMPDATGRVPLLLSLFLSPSAAGLPRSTGRLVSAITASARRPWSHAWAAFWADQFVKDMPAAIKTFSSDVKESLKPWHKAILLACIVQQRVHNYPPSAELYDTRFFHFDEGRRGQCLCGVARDSAVLVLQALTQGLAMQFNRTEWLLAAQGAPLGSPLRGFLAEKLALEAIRRRGLQGYLLVDVKWDCTFTGGGEAYAAKECNDEWTLFIPDTHNYPQIDGLLASSQPVNCQGADEVTRIALQITLQQPRQHKQTLGFFRGPHGRWEPCGDEKAAWCLVWVTPPPGDKVVPPLVERSSGRLANRPSRPMAQFHELHYSFGEIDRDLSFLDV